MRWFLWILILLFGAACSTSTDAPSDQGQIEVDLGEEPDPGPSPEPDPGPSPEPDPGSQTNDGGLLPFESCVFTDPTGMDKTLDVAYADLHELQALDIRTPKGKDGPFPVLIWIHGGAWKQGTKNSIPTWLQQIAAGDYAIASIDYRFSDNDWPASAADARASIRWLRAHASEYNLNPDQFGLLGSSAGGHLSGLVAVSADAEVLNGEEALGNWEVSGAVQAAAPFYGPHDLANLDPDRALSNCPDDKEMVHDEPDTPETLLLDCAPSYSSCPDLSAEASPISYVDDSDPPTFLVHGLEDCTIAPNQSVRMAQALQKVGVPTYLALVPEAGHNSSQCAEFGQLVIPLRAFFDRYVRGCDTEKFIEDYIFESGSE
jgi:acetyl esterase/lipase